ncbi:glycogen debranching protein [Virgisporangium aliadipatigenens]|uniref:Glycogen debranching protein n=1 Tax=Virgisporangium aliadipatigenens TaxID=741659 RepID=A0A8J4DRJ8_9ACTN|nr:amylo-alpha-1,6-glucosidase [Virgisporangium aliadipatigenens]GIJ46407.1 glycogen debranching protein [Virgisporangium aliadipatigenens]
MVGLGSQVLGDDRAGAAREWLVTDGLGGYAMGTASLLRTRRYHALQVISGQPAAVRTVGLVALDPVVTTAGGTPVELGVHEWADGTVHPTGHCLLERFELVDGLPRWRWRIGDVVLERELAMAHGRAALGVVHRLVSGGPVQLTLDALLTRRDAHGERGAGGPDVDVAHLSDGCVVEDLYRLRGTGWEPAGGWWRGAHTREEAARGLSATEDLWHAGRFAVRLTPGATHEVLCWAGDLDVAPRPPSALIAAARARAHAITADAGDAPDREVAATALLAADRFVITGANGPDVVAGYPWFGAWSRDTMISYEGLFLATGRYEEGRALLRGYAATLSEGMLANTADTGQTEFNTVDATLWFLHAVERHVARAGDADLAAELLPALLDVIEAHVAGTRYNIRMDPADGLISQGAPGVALTWMDARVEGVPVTPRHGKPVEVNALWVNALGGLGTLFDRVRGAGRPDWLEALHWRARASFAARFPAGDRLYDVIDGPSGDDRSLRPNQLLAYSLPYAPLPPDPAVLATVSAHLLTPLGLRTLAPDAPGYAPLHRGDPAARDAAYHQGTVWPWLLGPYIDCYRSLHNVNDSPLVGIEAHLAEWGLASISETADGQAPHLATGCPFQCWSVAEFVRVRHSPARGGESA